MLDAALLKECQRAIRPPSRLTVSEAVDGRRMLVGKAASEPGPWRNSRTPYWVDVMDALSPSDPCHTVVVMAGAQIGKTECGLNWEWYIPQYAPGPMMHVLPSEETARRVVSQRFDPMVEASPELSALIAGSKTGRGRGTRNRVMEKNFPGGVIFFAWAESPTMLRSMPARYLFVDEADAMKATPEGDPIELASRRLTTFARSKRLIVSTPTMKSSSRINAWFLRGDQRRLHVPCPFCGHFQVLEWGQIQILERDGNNLPVPGSVRYACKACGRHIEESAKTRMLAAGDFRPTAEGEPGIKSFHLPGLYSPVGWLSWEEIAREYVAAVHHKRETKNPDRLIVAINTMLGEPYDDEADEQEMASLTPDVLASRSEDREPLVVPLGAHLITIGVDVQGDRIEVSVYAWGRNEECWLIYHEAMWADPDQPGAWDGLDSLLDRKYESEDGRTRVVVSCAIDSGGNRTQEVYDYVMSRNRAGDRRVMAIKGANTAEANPIAPGNVVEVTYRGRRVRDGVRVWMVGTHKIKTVLRRRFVNEDPGPGYYHLLRMPQDIDGAATLGFCQQLLSERPVSVRAARGGGYRTEWRRVPPSQPAEAWDCYVYAYAAALRGGLTHVDWDKLLGPEGAKEPGPEKRVSGSESREGVRSAYPAPVSAPRPRRRIRGRSSLM